MELTPRQQLEFYYLQRVKRLESLKLNDILSTDPPVFWSPESESATEIVSRLIEKYLARHEAWWNSLIQDTEFCMKAIYLRRNVKPQRFLYEEELAKAHNRITLEFINRFTTSEYHVHYSNLFLFNSGAD